MQRKLVHMVRNVGSVRFSVKRHAKAATTVTAMKGALTVYQCACTVDESSKRSLLGITIDFHTIHLPKQKLQVEVFDKKAA